MTTYPLSAGFGVGAALSGRAAQRCRGASAVNVSGTFSISMSWPLRALLASRFTSSTTLVSNMSQPIAGFLATTFSATTGLTATIPHQTIGIFQGYAPATNATIATHQQMAGPTTLAALTRVFERDIQTMMLHAALSPPAAVHAVGGITTAPIAHFATLSPQVSWLQRNVNIPKFAAAQVSISAFSASDLFPIQGISAVLSGEAISAITGDIAPFTWDQYGSQLLYAAASGLEKAMIDADAPRLVGIDAELIIDVWDPQACPTPLLPYLAWAMGVTFWNDKWSEQTKRTWIDEQWQFKAWRGTAAAIEMAVDFAGRDISPFGYSVTNIITQPQGQYPSPGITTAQQEAWLATLPQVRVYQFQQTGTASRVEMYMNTFFTGP